MKKKTIALFVWLLSAKIVNAASWCTTIFCWWEDGLKAVKDNLPDNIIASDRLTQVIMWYAAYFLPYAWLFAFLALVYAWFLYVTSAANEENTETAKKIITYVAVGIILILLSYSITAFFINIS